MEITKYQNINREIPVSGQNIVPYLLSLSEYIQNSGINIIPYPKVIISSDSSFSSDPFGKTAYYDPEQHSVTLYIAGRHIKDILRSYAHELIHHNQNLSGNLNPEDLEGLHDPKYNQHNKHLRKMEMDAYLRGNMIFRDWTEQFK